MITLILFRVFFLNCKNEERWMKRNYFKYCAALQVCWLLWECCGCASCSVLFFRAKWHTHHFSQYYRKTNTYGHLTNTFPEQTCNDTLHRTEQSFKQLRIHTRYEASEKIIALTSELFEEVNHRECLKITFPDTVVPLCVFYIIH